MTNSQIAEKFASGAEKGNGSNMFIEGDVIYSYGFHFPIARRLNYNTVLYTSKGYSNSTAKHKNHVLGALIDANYKIVTVENPKEPLTNETLEQIYDDLLDLILKEKRSRKYKDHYRSQIESRQSDYKFIQSLL